MAIRRCSSFRQDLRNEEESLEERGIYDETEAFLQLAQEELSRSFHELVSSQVFSHSLNHRTVPSLKRRKSAIELTGVTGKHTFHVDDHLQRPRLSNPFSTTDQEIPRRKRFTRKARKSGSLEPNNLAIPPGLNPGESSSSEEDSPRGKTQSQRNRLLSNSSGTLSLQIREENSVSSLGNRQHLGRGPAARRANRKQAQRAADRKQGFQEFQGGVSRNGLYEKRSMSVRDLHGLEIDFSTQENVTRWASQILAELESLPTSRVDLNECGLEEMKGEDSKKRLDPSGLEKVSPDMTPPSKRHTVLLSPTDYDRDESLLNNNRAISASEMHLPTVPTSFLQSSIHRLSMSLHKNHEIQDSSNECTPRASPFLRSLETLKDDQRTRSDTTETLKAQENVSVDLDLIQPIYMAEARVIIRTKETNFNNNNNHFHLEPIIASKGKLDPNANISDSFHRLSPQRNEKEREETFAHREPLIEAKAKSLRSPIHEKIVRRKDPEIAKAQRREAQVLPSNSLGEMEMNEEMIQSISADPRPSIRNHPIPAPRKSIPNRIADWEHKCRNDSNKKIDRLEETNTRLQNSIAKLSQSVCGNLHEDRSNDEIGSRSLDRKGIPLIQKTLCNEDDHLEKWKKQAECRNRNGIQTTDRSVNRVISSLIEAAEESSRRASDRPECLQVTGPLSPSQDVWTQTSPFSLSRSSSFDWINSPTENTVPQLSSPIQNIKSETQTICREDSSEDTDCDAEVQEMTRGSHGVHEALDESLALLLQCAKEDQSMANPRPPPPLPYTKSTEESPMTSRRLKITATSIVTRYENSDRGWRDKERGFGLSTMNDSIYDNVPGKRNRKFTEPNIVRLSAIENESSLSALQQVSEAIGNLSRRESKREEAPFAFPIPLCQRAGSCELLSANPEDDPSEAYRTRMERLEEESRECCEWLRRAGFPQYAQEFEDCNEKFPLDLKTVHADHRFLDLDSLHALNRRLATLNRAAIMRMDRVVLRQKNHPTPHYEDSPLYDDDEVALSNRWHFQRHSHTWSRVGNEPIYGAGRELVSTIPDRADPQSVTSRALLCDQTHPQQSQSIRERTLQRSQSERIKERARAFIKKMDIRSSSRRRRDCNGGDSLVIGDPVLVSFDSASPESARMFRNAVTAGSSSKGENNRRLDVYPRGRSTRRQGVVLLSPSSPSSPETSDSLLNPDLSHRSLGPSTSKRDHSMPAIPRLPDPSQPSNLNERRVLPRTNPFDAYLYPNQSRTRSMVRKEDRLKNEVLAPYPQQYLLSPRGSNQQRSQPILHPDGYFMHDMSPNGSLTRRNGESNESPSTSLGSPSTNPGTPSLRQSKAHLHVSMNGESKMSQSSLDACTDNEDHSTQSTVAHPRRDSGVGSSLSRSPSGPSAQRVRASVMPVSVPSLLASVPTCVHNHQHISNHHVGGSSACGSWTSASSGGSRSGCRPPASSPLSASVSSSLSNKEEDTFLADEDIFRSIDALSLVDLSRIRKLAYLRITGMLEKHMGVGSVKMTSPSASNGTAVKNWTVQKLIKKIKQIDGTGTKIRDDTAFGVSLEQIYRRTGTCFPRSILEILRYLRLMSTDTVGIFRKNGVRSRIQELRDVADVMTERDVFVGDHRLLASQVHDAADLLKQFLRELPEPLMTIKLSETFAQIFLYLPKTERLLAMQYAVLLLPDENREALQTLLFFLNDIARHSDLNNMNAQNLSVCFTPSLFHLSASRLNQISPTRRHKTIGAAGMPTEKEMKEQRAAQDCLTMMVLECQRLFLVPEGCPVESTNFEEELPTLGHLGGCGYRSYLVRKFKDMLKDHQDRWKGYSSECTTEGIEVSSKKSPDGHPLRLMKAVTEVEAPPKEVLHRLLRERPVWDPATVNWRLVDNLQPDTDIFQYVLNDMPGHPTRDCYVVRMHKSDMGEIRGACALLERSIACSETQMLGGLRASVLDSRVLIEPHHGRSRVTFMQRIDLRGRGVIWYNRVYPVLLGRQVARLRDSFLKFPTDGPETKV